MGGLIVGYDFRISDSFLEKFFPSVFKKVQAYDSTDQYCVFDNHIVSLLMSSLYLAGLISSPVASLVTRKLGRRPSMMLGGVLFFAGALFKCFAQAVWMLIVGRVLQGSGMGFSYQSVPLYLSEMAPYKYRGALNAGFFLSITIGNLVANVLNYAFEKIKGGWGWRLSLGVAIVPALILIISSLVLPETPNSMIERGKQEEARAKLKRIRGLFNVDEEFHDLVLASEACQNVEHPWRDIVQREYTPYLTMAIAIPFFQQFTGLGIIIFYAPIFFQNFGIHASASLMSSVVLGMVIAFASVVYVYGVDKWGRRFFFLKGGIQMLLCQIVFSICIGTKFGVDGNPGVLPKWYSIVVVASICVYVAGYSWSWGPLAWLVPSEIFPLKIRSTAQSINVVAYMIYAFSAAQVFSFTFSCPRRRIFRSKRWWWCGRSIGTGPDSCLL